MTVAPHARRLASFVTPASSCIFCIVLVFTMMHIAAVPLAAQGKVSLVPPKPSVTPPRMTKDDVTKPAAHAPVPAKTAEHPKPSRPASTAANAKTTEHAAAAEHATPARAGKPAETVPADEHAKTAETTGGAHVVTPGRDRRRSAQRAVAALGAALTARRDRAARLQPPPEPPAPPAPVRRAAPHRRVAPAQPPAPPAPHYEVPWPSRIVELHWPTSSDERSVSWPTEKPAPIELRWDLKALQSDLSEQNAAVTR